MKRIIFTSIIAVFAWLTYINIFDWTLKVLTACVIAKLAVVVLSLFLTIIVQNLMKHTTGSLILKDQIEELGNIGTVYVHTTKTLLTLFILFCLFKCQNTMLLWLYASATILDNFVMYSWKTFIENMDKA